MTQPVRETRPLDRYRWYRVIVNRLVEAVRTLTAILHADTRLITTLTSAAGEIRPHLMEEGSRHDRVVQRTRFKKAISTKEL